MWGAIHGPIFDCTSGFLDGLPYQCFVCDFDPMQSRSMRLLSTSKIWSAVARRWPSGKNLFFQCIHWISLIPKCGSKSTGIFLGDDESGRYLLALRLMTGNADSFRFELRPRDVLRLAICWLRKLPFLLSLQRWQKPFSLFAHPLDIASGRAFHQKARHTTSINVGARQTASEN